MNEQRSQAYLNFLIQVLQTSKEGNSNPEVVYLLLQNNFEKLDDTFAEILYQWAITTLPTLESKQIYGVAEVIFDFSKLIQEFTLGNRGRQHLNKCW